MIKNILGLDIGTNSIGWALVEQDFENKEGTILGMGSRIIPMDQKILSEFGVGNSVSQTSERTSYRGVRRLRERHLLRRERLHRVLHILGFLPNHYDDQIDFENRFGKFMPGTEPKLAFSKNGFLFQNSFKEMLVEFKKLHPLKNEKGNDLLIPHDWTIYYLRKKALKERIEKEELAWIILNFNQKRGYYQLRGEEENEIPNKSVELHTLKVTNVTVDGETNKKGDACYSIYLENGWVYRRQSKIPLFDWKNKTKDFIVTTDLNDDGTIKLDKENNTKRSFRAPSADDWTLLKKKTEKEIEKSQKFVGTYIFDHLLLNLEQKIKGKLVRTIERKFYKAELEAILEKQSEFHSELQNEELFSDAIRELYRNNKQHQQTLENKGFTHLILEDILFYQRPLKSQKSNISNCTLESRTYKDENGVKHTQSIKVIAKSNPYYQEFRLLQWLKNLSIYRIDDDLNVNDEFLGNLDDRYALLEFLKSKKEIDQLQLIEFLLKRKYELKKVPKAEIEKYRWNYVQDKKYPCYETRNLILNRLEKVIGFNPDFLTSDMELTLWHIIYSVNDKNEYEKALKKFAEKNNINIDSFFEVFKKIPSFKSEYGSFSEKAIKKLLPLMRFGADYSYDNINPKIKKRIDKILSGEVDEDISNRVREKVENEKLKTELDFQNLGLWLAQYIIYGRHSEATIVGKWNSVDDIENFLKEFKQHSLRNPIVEQIILETLRLVKEVWSFYGKGIKNYFSEIHIELGRELKNTKDERNRLVRETIINENTNLRIKALLAELAIDDDVKNVRAYSPSQQEILKVFEDYALRSDETFDEESNSFVYSPITEEIEKISRTAQPSSSDLKRYKLWLEQRYRSPYTGQMIPLNKLFTTAYEVEHIIPQSRYFDDSFSNKVICEAEVNKLKDRQLGLEFIKNFHGYKISDNLQILEVEAYESFVKQNYSKSHVKRNKLLLEDIPEKMIARQLNDTRYISKYVSNLLSNLVRDEKEDNHDDGYNSKNLIATNGKITTKLKQDWGLEAIWNDLILPRFERMNELTKSTDFTSWNEKYQKFLPTVPLELSKGFLKKRIDHRHHALDALVIACATREHINLLNNESALPKKNKTREEQSKFRYDLQKKLRIQESYINKDGVEAKTFKEFYKPWKNFTQDARQSLENIIVSFKQNTRVINKATNYYEKWIDKDGKKVKAKVKQEGINWAIRKPLHKETVSGRVHLNRIKITKGKILTATRKSLDINFGTKAIDSITDTGIQKILLNRLSKFDECDEVITETSLANYISRRLELIKSKILKEHPEIAFSPEGIEELNQNIKLYNDGKNHQPILKVRVFEQGSRFSLGEAENKRHKFVETAKGTNLFFAIYVNKNGKRSYETIPLNVVIERQKQGLSSVPESNEKNDRLLFSLSPNDLVFVPIDGEEFDEKSIDVERIYKLDKVSGLESYFVRHEIASLIKQYDPKSKLGELESQNKLQTTMTEDRLKIADNCIKLKVDRLGNVAKA